MPPASFYVEHRRHLREVWTNFSFYLGAIPWRDFLGMTFRERLGVSDKLNEILEATGGDDSTPQTARKTGLY